MKNTRIFTALSENNVLYWFFSDNMGRSWQAVQLTEFTGPKELKIV